MKRWLAAALLFLAACAPPLLAGSAQEFERWVANSPERAAAFKRFEAFLQREGVADVVPSRELWLTDRIRPACVREPFTIPPEDLWPHIVPALRYIRDHVEPAIGDVTVVSGFRDRAFNACIDGASRSAHMRFYALDLMPRNPRITRANLIAMLCPIHAREGRRARVGMGIYGARRFHIDAYGYRGWGDDHQAASFPCGSTNHAVGAT